MFGSKQQLVLRAPVHSRRGSARARGAVVVEANLFSRAVRVIQSYANQIGEGMCPQRSSLLQVTVVDTQPQLC
jgi:hypothetical protein